MQIKPENSKKVIDLLYIEPNVNRNYLIDKTGIKSGTIKNIINEFLKNNIIEEKTGYSRNQVFSFEKYINFFK